MLKILSQSLGAVGQGIDLPDLRHLPFQALRAGTGRLAEMRVRPPSRAIKRRWAEVLEEIGPLEVRSLLYSRTEAEAGAADRFVHADAGLLCGEHRFPTRHYVQEWLGDGDDEHTNAVWRILTVIVLVAVAITYGFVGLV